MRTRIAASWLTLALLATLPSAAYGQGLGERLRRRAEESLARKAERAVDCVMGDAACVEKAKAEGKQVNVVPAKDAPADTAQAGAKGADALKPGEGAWANYDFKPGERILFADDFMKDEVGDFPRSMEFVSGSIETVLWQGTRYMRLTTDGKFIVPIPETLPERYTMEFDIAIPSGTLWLFPTGEEESDYIIFANAGVGGYYPRGKEQTTSPRQEALDGKMYRARVMADGRYLKLYINEKRVANIPNAIAARTNKILFFTDASEQEPTLFGNFRIAAGGKKLYDALAEKGRVATQGIYFDTGSDRIRPESTPTLKEIGAMLTEHPELTLAIEGHTDNVGNAASNQALSEKRAAAVVKYLVESSGVDAARLSSKGLGATKPAASNDTPEGRQNNRRVELVKM